MQQSPSGPQWRAGWEKTPEKIASQLSQSNLATMTIAKSNHIISDIASTQFNLSTELKPFN